MSLIVLALIGLHSGTLPVLLGACAALPVAIRFSALFFHQMSAVWFLGCTINTALIVIMILSFTIN